MSHDTGQSHIQSHSRIEKNDFQFSCDPVGSQGRNAVACDQGREETGANGRNTLLKGRREPFFDQRKNQIFVKIGKSQYKKSFLIQIAKHKDQTQRLGQNGSHSSALKSHKMYKHRVQDTIQQCTDQHSDHLKYTVSKASQHSGKIAVEIHSQIPYKINRQILPGRFHHFFRRVQQDKDRPQKNFQDHRHPQ